MHFDVSICKNIFTISHTSKENGMKKFIIFFSVSHRIVLRIENCGRKDLNSIGT